MYTLQALCECYSDLLLAMRKHLGHNETIEPQIPGQLQFVPQLNRFEFFLEISQRNSQTSKEKC